MASATLTTETNTSSWCDENECGIVWIINEYKSVNQPCRNNSNPGYNSCGHSMNSSFQVSPFFESSNGSKWFATLQMSTYYFVTNGKDGNIVSTQSWLLNLTLGDDNKIVNNDSAKDVTENCSVDKIFFTELDKNCIEAKVAVKMKDEMNSPVIHLFNSPSNTVKKIRIAIYIKNHVPNFLSSNPTNTKLSNLFGSEKFCDVTIQVDKRTFRAHKCVLGAHSEVFETMFETNMVEKKTDSIRIDDLQPEAVKAMLQFIYDQKDPQFHSAQLAREVYRAAHKYHIIDLLKLCRIHLVRLLGEDNAVETLSLSHLYSDAKLKKLSFLFCSSEMKHHTFE